MAFSNSIQIRLQKSFNNRNRKEFSRSRPKYWQAHCRGKIDDPLMSHMWCIVPQRLVVVLKFLIKHYFYADKAINIFSDGEGGWECLYSLVRHSTPKKSIHAFLVERQTIGHNSIADTMLSLFPIVKSSCADVSRQIKHNIFNIFSFCCSWYKASRFIQCASLSSYSSC